MPIRSLAMFLPLVLAGSAMAQAPAPAQSQPQAQGQPHAQGQPYAQACMTDGDARQAIIRNSLLPVGEAVRHARGGAKVDLVSVRLCETQGVIVYMLALLAHDGKLQRIVVDARSGDILSRN